MPRHPQCRLSDTGKGGEQFAPLRKLLTPPSSNQSTVAMSQTFFRVLRPRIVQVDCAPATAGAVVPPGVPPPPASRRSVPSYREGRGTTYDQRSPGKRREDVVHRAHDPTRLHAVQLGVAGEKEVAQSQD